MHIQTRAGEKEQTAALGPVSIKNVLIVTSYLYSWLPKWPCHPIN